MRIVLALAVAVAVLSLVGSLSPVCAAPCSPSISVTTQAMQVDHGMLPHLLRNGAVDAALARRIGHHLARFHASAATGLGADQHGSPTIVRANWDEAFRQTEALSKGILPAETRDEIAAYVARFLQGQRER